MGLVRHIILAMGAALLAAGAAQAQTGGRDQVGATGTMTVLDPVAISQTTELGHGAIARPRSGAGPIDVPGATYTVTGQSGETFNVTTPASIKLSRVGGTDEIQLTLTPSQTTGQVPGAAGLPGSTTIGLRGQAPVDKGTANGVYVGKYGLTVAYP